VTEYLGCELVRDRKTRTGHLINIWCRLGTLNACCVPLICE
jgi:hypothetical protein